MADPLAAAREVDGQSLAEAFSCFARAAASLEQAYSQLQMEVARLRQELEQTNRDLEQSLAENHRIRQHLNRILEALPCGVVVVEPDGTVSLANPEARHLINVAAGSALPGRVAHLFTLATCSRREVEYGRVSGEAEWVALRRSQLSPADGGSAIFILEDVSELKRYQSEHEQLRRREALAEMSATLAHEVRNPLGSMELFAGLLAESALSGEQREWTGHFQSGLRTLAATVNNVLRFHSLPQAELISVDLGELLDSLAQFLEPQARQAGVKIELDHRLAGVMVPADRHAIGQVIHNLARNAFAVLAPGGTVEISGQASGIGGDRKARVAIADNGPGITPEIQGKIFDPGFSTRPGSSGLGLAVCQAIMEQHRGAIHLERPAGGGARFVLEFPFSGESK